MIERLGDAYAITMKPNRGTQYSGIAIRTENHLAVCYSFPGLGERGVGSFVIGSDGNLTGQWAVLGRDGKLLDDKWTKTE